MDEESEEFPRETSDIRYPFIPFEVEEMRVHSLSNPRVRALSDEEIASLGKREWWGLPSVLTGLTFIDVASIVITGLCLACTFEIGGIITTLCEFIRFAAEGASYFLFVHSFISALTALFLRLSAPSSTHD